MLFSGQLEKNTTCSNYVLIKYTTLKTRFEYLKFITTTVIKP